MKNNGFTLIETLIGVSVIGVLSAGALSNLIEETERDSVTGFIIESASVIRAVDGRIAIDGYDPLLWNKLSWTHEADIVNNLIGKELTSKYLTTCSGGDWEPSVISERDSKLIACDLWKYRKVDDLNMYAEITQDSVGYINKFELQIGFNNDESFDEMFKNMKKAMLKLKSSPQQEQSGTYIYDFISKSTDDPLTTTECVNNISDCVLSMSLERAGGNEYVRADGGNSMVNSHLTFVETKGDSPLKCVKWRNPKKDGTGTWVKMTLLDEACGVGIYEKTGHPAMVDVGTHNGTFKNVLLNQDCNLYKKSGKTVVTDGISPCGTLDNGDIIQVVDNVNAVKVLANEASFRLTTIDQLVANQISAETLEVANMSNLSDVEVVDWIKIGGNTTIDSTATIKKDLDLNGTLSIGQSMSLDGGAVINNEMTSTTRMAAPVGEFNNIDAELNDIQNMINHMNNTYNSN